MTSMPEHLRTTTPVARKVHRCGLCGSLIQIGEKHRKQVNVYDGRAYDFRECQACEGIVAKVWTWAGCPDEGIVDDDADEWAHENLNEPGLTGDIARALLRRWRGVGCACVACVDATAIAAEEAPDA